MNGDSLTGWDDPLLRVREALKNDEFALYCQTMQGLQAGGHPFAEVLVRLREEEAAMLPPGEFLPVLEHYGMMPQLDCWVLRTLAAAVARGSQVPRFAMNVSAQTLQLAEFPKIFAKFAADAGIAPGAILVELEEADMLAYPEEAERFSAGMREAGGSVVIAGFGAKSATFAPVKALRPELIKVDGSIVRRLLKSEAAARKLEAIMRVSGTLGIGLIAECVEEREVLARLREMGVGYAQGFGIARPQPIESLASVEKPSARQAGRAPVPVGRALVGVGSA
jgi:EAL domain-containing protein (putative c-di-GMP-specific phosphodiesterase class I)